MSMFVASIVSFGCLGVLGMTSVTLAMIFDKPESAFFWVGIRVAGVAWIGATFSFCGLALSVFVFA